MKKILIIAGPNGAGKTTFAQEFLPNEASCPQFLNADLIAAGLSPFQSEKVTMRAGRLMVERMNELFEARESFAIETTLSSSTYKRLIPKWQIAGYLVKLYFFKIPDAEFAIKRVAQRVSLGGHDIPEETIRRRFERGWTNLKTIYLSLVDEWAVYDGSKEPPVLIETGINDTPKKLMEEPVGYQASMPDREPVTPLDDPDFIGAEAAMKRASAKAVAVAKAAGLEPVVIRNEKAEDTEATSA